MRLKTFSIFLVFFVMGFGDAVGTLVGFATKEFELSKGMAGLLPFFGLIAFGFFSVPVSILAEKKGKKFILITFLSLTLVGLLIPVINISQYYFVLISIFFLGLGMCGLQVASNPAMREVSDKGNFSRNLTFAQFIKSIGSNTAPYAIPLIIGVFGMVWQNIFLIYAVVVAVSLILVLPVDLKQSEEKPPSRVVSLKSSFALLRNPLVALMVLGIFLYVGAEVGLNSWIATYLQIRFDLELSSLATLGIGFFLTSLAVGRLLGSIVLNFLSARKFFVVSSFLGLAGLLGLFVQSETVAIVSIIIIGLGFGNIFPLIFSILIDRMPEHDNELSGLLVMAIVGGAVVPALMGVVADWSIIASFCIPVVIFVYIVFLAFYNLNYKSRK